tara:strand:+ start:2673 stop:2891 length:219 start_codon:yes stop_codon:yes gene_type:complete
LILSYFNHFIVKKKTPPIIKKIPITVLYVKGSLKKTIEKIETNAIAPDVSIGCATLSGNFSNAKIYNTNAKP